MGQEGGKEWGKGERGNDGMVGLARDYVVLLVQQDVSSLQNWICE